MEEVKKKTTKKLEGITLQEFQNCFEKWKTRLDWCIASNGQYFEEDSGHLKINIQFSITNIQFLLGPPT
jgi:hypothetical protein